MEKTIVVGDVYKYKLAPPFPYLAFWMCLPAAFERVRRRLESKRDTPFGFASSNIERLQKEVEAVARTCLVLRDFASCLCLDLLFFIFPLIAGKNNVGDSIATRKLCMDASMECLLSIGGDQPLRSSDVSKQYLSRVNALSFVVFVVTHFHS